MKNTIALVAVILSLTACSTAPPTPQPEPVPAPEPGTEDGNQLGAIRYTIKTGDNLVLIAAEQTRASENWRRIADFNRIQNPATIKPGQVIWIPNDLIPLTNAEQSTRSIAGHPDATVRSVQLPRDIQPLSN